MDILIDLENITARNQLSLSHTHTHTHTLVWTAPKHNRVLILYTDIFYFIFIVYNMKHYNHYIILLQCKA